MTTYLPDCIAGDHEAIRTWVRLGNLMWWAINGTMILRDGGTGRHPAGDLQPSTLRTSGQHPQGRAAVAPTTAGADELTRCWACGAVQAVWRPNCWKCGEAMETRAERLREDAAARDVMAREGDL